MHLGEGSAVCCFRLQRRKRNLKSLTIIILTDNPKVFIRHKGKLSLIKRFLFIMQNLIPSSPSQTPISSIRSAFCLLIVARLLTLPNSPSSCSFSSSITFLAYIYCHYLINPLNSELNPICYLLALLGAHHFLHVSRIRVKLLTFRLLMSYISIYIYIWSTHS